LKERNQFPARNHSNYNW